MSIENTVVPLSNISLSEIPLSNVSTPQNRTVFEEDTPGQDENEDDLIPDIPDDEEEIVEETFDKLESLAEELSLTTEQAYMLYAGEIDPKYWAAQSVISEHIANLELSIVDKIICVLQAEKEKKEENAKSTEKVQPPHDSVPKKSKTLITVKKGLQEHEIKEYLKQIDTKLKDDKTDVVSIHCPDWANDTTHPCFIPACKKLLVKYCEMGLLGCLVNHDYQNVAHELYCFAYAKGKLVDDKVRFENIDINDYKIKVTESVKKFWMLIDGIKE